MVMFVVSFTREHEDEAYRFDAVVSEALRRGHERIDANPKLALTRFEISVRTVEQGVLFVVVHVPASRAVH